MIALQDCAMNIYRISLDLKHGTYVWAHLRQLHDKVVSECLLTRCLNLRLCDILSPVFDVLLDSGSE